MTIIRVKDCANCHITHEWQFSSPRLSEGRYIKERLGWTIREFWRRSTEVDPDALTILLDILHRRDGIVIPFDQIELNDLDDMEYVDESAPEQGDAPEDAKDAGKASTTKNGLTSAAES